ncbi:NACHT, LRR and PYD domains-containing protein 4-like [Actinia tenebrosa]|uniref:NACHT, LRR and PYD domains-containing protein 4-like n=1 Tax=Actinia tenebrosa TaxID=6105 RepID=A0A6P8J6S2_ACTTE|nr:NACHT, LRR and PYD domains-containing protein 4-like [Actinia tenebrosa]
MKDARIKCRHSVCCERDFPEGIELKEINRIAARWASFKKEKEIARQCRLLIDGGTRALKDVFDSIHSPSSLHSTLHSTTVHSTLNGLRTEKILSEQQWDRLYPSSPSTPVTSADFDITLLFVLLRNICGLTPPPTGWDKPPVATDLSREADLARVKYYRNELYGHITETAVSDSDFDKYWSEISDALVRLGGPHYKPEIERMKIDTMDPEQEKNFIGALEEWEEMEQTILQKMEEILAKRVKRNSADASQAKEYTEKLKSSIKQQTDFLLSEEEDKKIRTDDIFTSVTIQRGPKHFKEPKEKRFGRRQLDEYQASSTELTNCSEMFLCPENDDQQSTASCTTNPKSILLTGKAGIGKSLLCRKLVRDWSHDRLFEEGQENAKVPDFQFVFLLTFCQLLEEEEKRLDLRDILNRSSLLNDHSVIDEPLLQYIIENPEKLLIVLDGYDEYKHRERITGDLETRYPNDPYDKIPVPALIGKIMKGKMLNGAVVLLSSRPEEAEELKEIVFDVRCDIQRFSSLQVLEYIEKYFNANKSMKNKVLDHIKTNEILLSFGHIPVMCFLMCYCIIWRMTESKTTEKRLPVTRTELYRQVIILFIKKHSSSKYEEMEETKVQELLHKLAELAVNLMMEDKYFFDENDMEKFNLNDEEITNLKASGLIDCCPGVKISPSEKPPLEFAFTDVTIQEFLCAFLFVEKKQIPEKKKTSDVTFMFMAGMFSREKEEKRMEKLIENIKPGNEYDKRNKLLTLSCLYEYKDDGFSTRVMNNLKHIYCRDG